MHLLIYLLSLILIVMAASALQNGSMKKEQTDVGSALDRKIWSVCEDRFCGCGQAPGDLVMCLEDHLLIQPCFCLYYDSTDNQTYLGNCMLTCYYVHYHDPMRNYYQVDRLSVQNASQFNEAICGNSYSHIEANREGRFCGACKEGFGLAAYSYHYTSCIPCRQSSYKNWLLYFTIALLPLTLFYIIVVLSRINLISSRYNGVLFVLQNMSASTLIRMYDGWVFANSKTTYLKVLYKIFMTIFGICNLDFFRSIYPYFCLSPNMNVLHVMSLDYIIAVYPFFLIFLTYWLVNMYDKNYRLVVWAWKPFKWCTQHFGLDMKTSLIETFATFILLSYIKILGICFDLIAFTQVYDATGKKLNKWYSLYDANLDYLKLQHFPFVLLSLVTGLLFVVLPFFLLVLYPFRWFQKCLNCLGVRSQAFHIFMDAFQGSYRLEPRDMRHFSAFYLLLRFLLVLTPNLFASSFFMPINALLMILSLLLLAVVQPYKKALYNVVDLIALTLLSLFYVSFSTFLIASYTFMMWANLSHVFLGASAFSIAVYSVIVLLLDCKPRILIKKIFQRRPSNLTFNNILESTSSIGREDYESMPNENSLLLTPD